MIFDHRIKLTLSSMSVSTSKISKSGGGNLLSLATTYFTAGVGAASIRRTVRTGSNVCVYRLEFVGCHNASSYTLFERVEGT